jgi:hypothetical protein
MAISKITSSGLAGDKYNVMTAGNNYYEPLASRLLNTATASITFSDIPQGYKHLQIRGIIANTGGLAGFAMTFNSDTSANYAWHYLQGSGTGNLVAGATTSTTSITGALGINTANIFGGSITDILDYKDTNKYKIARIFHGYDANGSGYSQINSGLWMSTAAITSITFTCGSGNFAINTRLSLYGLKG